MQDYQKLFALKGKTALITGGSSGLGHAIAEAFLQSGANLIIFARNPKAASDLETYAAKSGSGYLGAVCDITNAADVDRALSETKAAFPSIDILVNSAGINHLCPAEDYDEEHFIRVFDINVKGMHLVTKSVARQFMIPAGHGRILNLSSVKGTVGATENYLAYCASKGAVNMYTKQIACEWGKYQITANAIAPTFVRTPINSAQLDDP